MIAMSMLAKLNSPKTSIFAPSMSEISTFDCNVLISLSMAITSTSTASTACLLVPLRFRTLDEMMLVQLKNKRFPLLMPTAILQHMISTPLSVALRSINEQASGCGSNT